MVAREVRRRSGVPGLLTEYSAVPVSGNHEQTCAREARRCQQGTLKSLPMDAEAPGGLGSLPFAKGDSLLWYHISQSLLITPMIDVQAV